MSAEDVLLDVLTFHIRRGRGERAAVLDQDGTTTYAELARSVEQRVRELRTAGVRAGTPVGVVMTARVRSIVDFAAANAIGAAVLVLQERMVAGERTAALSDFGAARVIGPDGIDGPRSRDRRHDESTFAVTSSGTTGRPKVISRAWAGTLRNSADFARTFGIDVDDIVLTTSPLGHSYAIEAGTFAVFRAGACQMVPEGPLSPARARTLIERHRPTILQTVPIVLDWWGRGGVARATPWRRCVSAGEALPAPAAARWRAEEVPVFDHYGNSELGQLTLDPDGGSLTAGVGRALPDVQLRAGEGSPAPVSARVTGLAPVRFEAGAPVPLADADGWVTTGDLGVIERDGLRLTGRGDMVINIGGNKVSPIEVEEVMRSLPGVEDCAVVGRHGPDGRRQVWAFVEADDVAFDAAALRRRAGEVLTSFKVPAVIRRVDALPRTGSGKLRRGLLIEDES
ncbi:class I adenylate-forming enzyme family protein [Nocardia bovistercoris]|uniref:Acyl--CoA ligase n=1 Tax=Nocardia bovistercoris TaxID=2785916 RepID=A0A931N3P4_9NOCA|nr:class I adenylate-forming enzyme family protein [Nocardia bovistercoris]MBH0780860.1 acyl--CoA ligase [Nocardia bovistercoris]